jgi:hypothetical protein
VHMDGNNHLDGLQASLVRFRAPATQKTHSSLGPSPVAKKGWEP